MIYFFKEKILLDAMFEVPESDIITVKVDEDVILGKKGVEYVRRTVEKEEKGQDESLETEEENKAKTYA